MCRIPRHVEVQGNELADSFSNETCEQPSFTERNVSTDVVNYIKHVLHNELQATVHNKLRYIIETVLQ